MISAPARWRNRSSWPAWIEFVQNVRLAGTESLLPAIGAGDEDALDVAIDSVILVTGVGDWSRCARVEVDAWLRGAVLAGHDYLFTYDDDDPGQNWSLYMREQFPNHRTVWFRPRLDHVNWYPIHRADTFFYASLISTMPEIAYISGHKAVFIDGQLRTRTTRINDNDWPGDREARYVDHWNGVVYGPSL